MAKWDYLIDSTSKCDKCLNATPPRDCSKACVVRPIIGGFATRVDKPHHKKGKGHKWGNKNMPSKPPMPAPTNGGNGTGNIPPSGNEGTSTSTP